MPGRQQLGGVVCSPADKESVESQHWRARCTNIKWPFWRLAHRWAVREVEPYRYPPGGAANLGGTTGGESTTERKIHVMAAESLGFPQGDHGLSLRLLELKEQPALGAWVKVACECLLKTR